MWEDKRAVKRAPKCHSPGGSWAKAHGKFSQASGRAVATTIFSTPGSPRSLAATCFALAVRTRDTKSRPPRSKRRTVVPGMD